MSPKPTLTSPTDAKARRGISDSISNAIDAHSLEAFREAGVTSVVSLLEDTEACNAGLSAEPTIAETLGMTFITYPIKDYALPVSEPSYLTFVRELWQLIHHGEQVLVHCYGGIGRSGMVVAGILIYDGLTPDEAFDYASDKRKHSVPDTAEQKQWVTGLHQSLVNLRPS